MTSGVLPATNRIESPHAQSRLPAGAPGAGASSARRNMAFSTGARTEKHDETRKEPVDFFRIWPCGIFKASLPEGCLTAPDYEGFLRGLNLDLFLNKPGPTASSTL